MSTINLYSYSDKSRGGSSGNAHTGKNWMRLEVVCGNRYIRNGFSLLVDFDEKNQEYALSVTGLDKGPAWSKEVQRIKA